MRNAAIMSSSLLHSIEIVGDLLPVVLVGGDQHQDDQDTGQQTGYYLLTMTKRRISRVNYIRW